MPKIIDNLRATYLTNPAAALNLLPELFQAEEEGYIKQFPCKVGDMVWIKSDLNDKGYIQAVICQIDITKLGNVYRYSYEQCGYHLSDDDFGKTVFLTREAAEKRLESDNNA